MKTVYTDYVKTTYNGKTYYIRAWLKYEISDDPGFRKITFSAGFNTKGDDYAMGNIKMECYDSVGNDVSVTKEWKKQTSAEYVSERTWLYAKRSTPYEVTFKYVGTFGNTRFSGKKAWSKLKITVPVFGEPQVDLVGSRASDTSATITLKLSSGNLVGEEAVISEPVLKRNGTTLSLSWTSIDGAVTFPLTLDLEPNVWIPIWATDSSITPMQSYNYEISGTITTDEAYSYSEEYTVEYAYEPEWKPPDTMSSGNPAITFTGMTPDLNGNGNAVVDVYAYDYTQGEYVLLPNDDGWEIEIVDSTHFKLGVTLTEQYVQDPTAKNTQAMVKLQYVVYTADDLDKELAIFRTNRTANFTTGLANNVFIGGCSVSGYQSRVWYSAVNDPLYIPDTNFVEAGSNDTMVMGLVKVGDYLGAVKQSASTDTSVYLIYPTSFEAETTFATKPCVAGVGALGQFCFNVLNGEPLFLSPRGVMAIEFTADEQSRVQDRSYYVNGDLLEQPNLESAYSFVWRNMYLLAVNNHVYVLDGSQRNSWGNQKTNLVYECYYLDNVPAKCMFSYDEELWFSDFDGNICRFKNENDEDPYKDEDDNVEATWSTIADDDGAIHYYKNLSKKGCLVSLLPEEGTTALVYLKKDENPLQLVKESAPFPENEEHKLPASVYTKKKIKKYKRLQFIVRDITDKPFGIDKIVKSYTVGNYAKK